MDHLPPQHVGVVKKQLSKVAGGLVHMCAYGVNSRVTCSMASNDILWLKNLRSHGHGTATLSVMLASGE